MFRKSAINQAHRDTNSAAPPQHTGHYRADIDGLRAVAVLLVICFHAFPSLIAGGFIGVDIFFVISGFLISGILLEQLQLGRFSLTGFYARRIKRILPALLLVMASCFAFGWFALPAVEYQQLGKHVAAGAGFVSNLTLWQESSYFDNAADSKPLLHLWSLAIEEQFYLLWPILLWAGFKARVNRLWLCLVLLALSFGMNAYFIQQNPVATFYSPMTRFWELLIGAALAQWQLLQPSEKQPVWLQHGLSLIGGIALVCALLLIHRERAFPGYWALLPTLAAACLIGAGPQAWLNRKLLAHPLLVWLGLISYPLYLWHWPLLVYAKLAQYNATPPWQIRALALLLSILLAYLSYRFLEKPIRFGRHSRGKIIALCSLLALLGFVGYNCYQRDGYPFRTANAKVSLFAEIVAPVETRITNNSCTDLLQRQPVPGAICLVKSSQPDILIAGDSHAMVLNSAAYMGNFPLNTVLVAGHGCLPFLRYQSFSPTDDRNAKPCRQIAEEGLAIAQATPSIQTVLLVSRGPLYFSGQGFGEAEDDARYRGWTIEAAVGGGAEKGLSSQAAFVQAYVETAQRYLSLGKRVVFVIDVPEFGINPEYCIANRPIAFRNQSLPTCILPRAVVDQRQAEYRQLIAQITAQVPQLQVFDTINAFCNANTCSSKDANHVYFFDNNHINLSGSSKVLGELTAWLARTK